MTLTCKTSTPLSPSACSLSELDSFSPDAMGTVFAATIRWHPGKIVGMKRFGQPQRCVLRQPAHPSLRLLFQGRQRFPSATKLVHPPRLGRSSAVPREDQRSVSVSPTQPSPSRNRYVPNPCSDIATASSMQWLESRYSTDRANSGTSRLCVVPNSSDVARPSILPCKSSQRSLNQTECLSESRKLRSAPKDLLPERFDFDWINVDDG